jgi:hypothetical protein
MSSIKFIRIAIIIVLFFSRNAYASLSVHPQQLVDTVIAGQKSTIIIHLTNLGPSSSLSYQLSSSESWISFNSVSGDIKVKDTTDIEVQVDATKLKQGSYKANIIVGDPHHGPITVPIEIKAQSISDVYESSENNSLYLMAYPNPFNANTEISYTLPYNQNIIIKVFDLNGTMIQSLIDEFQIEGKHQLTFDSSKLMSGVYFLTLNTSSFSIVKQLFVNK